MLGQPFLLCFQQQRNPGFKFVVGVSYANLWLVYEKCSSAATTARALVKWCKGGLSANCHHVARVCQHVL
jgi:hypothetical protein